MANTYDALGVKFWKKLVDKLVGRTLSDDDYNYVDSLDQKAKAMQDRNILAELDIYLENDEQHEKYFKNDMYKLIDKNYG